MSDHLYRIEDGPGSGHVVEVTLRVMVGTERSTVIIRRGREERALFYHVREHGHEADGLGAVVEAAIRERLTVEVVSDPEVMSGDPTVSGTRVPAETVVAYLRAGRSDRDILEDYPTLPPGAVDAVRRWAAGHHGADWLSPVHASAPGYRGMQPCAWPEDELPDKHRAEALARLNVAQSAGWPDPVAALDDVERALGGEATDDEPLFRLPACQIAIELKLTLASRGEAAGLPFPAEDLAWLERATDELWALLEKRESRPADAAMVRIDPVVVAARYPDLLAADATVWAGSGWWPLVEQALDRLAGQPVVVARIREHCASLQIAVQPRGSWSDESYALAAQVSDEALEASRTICEVCGKLGRPRVPGPGVRCDEHAAIR